ncbi:MAG: hypothetical protein B6I17_00155 [Tenericutes bacterium 4572_104]|nr:MAG: hypothetical protein B6I17_00155 [Tenericutes bacterium 4572_104]
MKLYNKNKVTLHSYKHDQTLHRVWKSETILEENDDVIIVANKQTKVVESNGRFWYTKEPSVSFLFKKHWYNVIAIFKDNTINYYCNLSSPILKDDEALKYIDYDLDIKVDKNFNYTILDRNEYKRNQKIMNYPDKIKQILLAEMQDLINRIESREFPFQKEIVKMWYNKYLNLEKKNKKK